MENKQEELIDLVESWARDKKLHQVDPRTQYTKFVEKIGELNMALLKSNVHGNSDVIDSIGDIQVTLIIYCLIRNIDIKKIYNDNPLEKYQDSECQLVTELNNKEIIRILSQEESMMYLNYLSSKIIEGYNKENSDLERDNLILTIGSLENISTGITNLTDSLAVAYNEIKDRKEKNGWWYFCKKADKE